MDTSPAGPAPIVVPAFDGTTPGGISLASHAFDPALPAPMIRSDTPGPGVVALDPQPDGIHYTMPLLPSGASSMSLEKSVDGGATWNEVVAGLGGGATGIDATGAPKSSDLVTFSIFAVGTPGTGYEPGGHSEGGATTILGLSSGGLVAVYFADEVLDTGGGAYPYQLDPPSYGEWHNTSVGDLFSVGPGAGGVIRAANVQSEVFYAWGEAAGFGNAAVRYRVKTNTGDAGGSSETTTADVPADPASAPAVTDTGEDPPASGQYWMEVTLPASLPARAQSFRLYADSGAGEPTSDRGLFDPDAVVNNGGVDFGAGNPCGAGLTVGCKGHNIYGDSAGMNYDDGFETPAC